jgi:hypothetical protein
MALNPSGIMSIGGPSVGSSINLELSLPATANSSLNQANFRALAGVPAGLISLSNFYGKANVYGAGYRMGGQTNLAYTGLWPPGSITANAFVSKFSFVTETESTVAPAAYGTRAAAGFLNSWNFSNRWIFQTGTNVYYAMPYATEVSTPVAITGITQSPSTNIGGPALVDSTAQVAYSPGSTPPAGALLIWKTPNATLATANINNAGTPFGPNSRGGRGTWNAQSAYAKGYFIGGITGSPPNAIPINVGSRFNYPTETQNGNVLAGPFNWTNQYCSGQINSTTNGYAFGGMVTNSTPYPFRNTIYKMPFATESLNTTFASLPAVNFGAAGLYSPTIGYSVGGVTNPVGPGGTLTSNQNYAKFPYATETQTTTGASLNNQYRCITGQSTPQNAA